MSADQRKQLEQITDYVGVINKTDNPFAKPYWISQGFPLTYHRKERQMAILDKKTGELKAQNSEKYVAFVAIRWGIAWLDDGTLI